MWTPRLLHKKAWIYREGDGQLSQGTEETKRLGGVSIVLHSEWKSVDCKCA